MTTLNELQTDLRDVLGRAEAVVGRAEQAGRDLTAEEATEHEGLITRGQRLGEQIRREHDRAELHALVRGGRVSFESGSEPGGHERDRRQNAELVTRTTPPPPPAHPTAGGRALSVRRDQTLRDWATRAGVAGLDDTDPLSFDGIVRGLATGRWDGFEREQRAISESPTTAGGHMVPTPVALDVIDRARNAARVLAAGATVVPMTSQTVKYPRLVTEGSPSWRNEAALINDTAMTFDSVTLTARSLAIMVRCSWELFEDAPPSSGVVADSFAQQMGLELDRVALRGSGTAPEPRGIRNQTGVTVTAFGGTNGAAPTNYDLLLDAAQVLRAANYEPTGIIHSPRTENTFSKLKESTTNAYLQPPPQLAAIPRYSTNQVPTNLTAGTSSDTSEIYVGEWRHLLVGMRIGMTIQMLTERYADTGEYAFLAHLRADVQLSQPGAFNVISGVRP